MISIITPAYNRADLLPRAYESLRAQSSYDFEWIIIDDGSNDGTARVVQPMLKEKLFKVRFWHQKNGGKHRALNFGVKQAKGEFVIILDSDDYLDGDAILNIQKWIKEIADDQKFAGVSGLKAYPDGKTVGGQLSDDVKFIDASNIERGKYQLQGDKAEVYRTKLLQKYPFPEIDDEKFIDEAIVWDKIAADGYKIRWFNKPIYYCEYLEGGLTSLGNKRYINNFKGYTMYVNQRIKLYSGLDRMKSVGVYASVAKTKKISMAQAAKKLGVSVIAVTFAYYLKLIKDIIKNRMTRHGA